ALAARALVVRRAVAVRVVRVAAERRAAVARADRAAVRGGAAGRRDARVREHAIEAVAGPATRAVAAARLVVLPGDLDALAALARAVGDAEAAAARGAVGRSEGARRVRRGGRGRAAAVGAGDGGGV